MEDLVGEILEYLDGKSILFGMASVSKIVRSRISHEHAVRCAMATPAGRRRMESLANLIRKGCIYTPSPMRILRLCLGKRCERCNSENCNKTRPNEINNLGLFLCRLCYRSIVTEFELRKEFGLVSAVIKDERCAKRIERFRKKKRTHYFVGRSPFVDTGGERCGPLVSRVSLSKLPTASSSDIPASSQTLDKFFDEMREDDPHRRKAPSILKAVIDFGPKYNHFGIVYHMAPRMNWNYFSADWKVLIEWENGERTWESLTRFAEDDFDSCALYAKQNGLLDTTGWERFRT